MLPSDFYKTIQSDPSWHNILPLLSTRTVHVAIMVEPFLSLLLKGEKTIESRFSKHRIAPYQKVKPGDLILLKKSSGPVVASFVTSNVTFYELSSTKLAALARTKNKAIGANADFWKAQSSKRYATLIEVSNVQLHNPKPFPKKDPRGWVVLK